MKQQIIIQILSQYDPWSFESVSQRWEKKIICGQIRFLGSFDSKSKVTAYKWPVTKAMCWLRVVFALANIIHIIYSKSLKKEAM